MREQESEPGPRAADKLGPTADPGHPQPDVTEVESARLLENQSRDTLEARGIPTDEIRRLADEYIALDMGEDVGAFVEWAVDRAGARRSP